MSKDAKKLMGGMGAKLGKVSLRNKILGASALVTLMVGLALTWQANRRIRGMAEEELLAKGLDAGKAMQAQIEQYVMMGSADQLAVPMSGLKANPVIYFAVVTDAKKKILASTYDNNDVPKTIADGLFDEADDREGGSRKRVGGKVFLEADVPLMQGALGEIHLGLDPAYVSGVVNKQTRSALLTLALVLALGLGGLALLLDRLVRPIVILSEVTRRIVDEGDLTQEIKVESLDEVGVLAGHFKSMVGRLRQIPLDLGKNARLLKEAVEAMEQNIQAQNENVTRQATALQETQVTAEEIKQTSQMAAKTAAGILEEAAKADELGKSGEASVEQSMQGLAELKAFSEDIAAKISELNEKTRQIGGITNTVKELADQSNMLALNAAIEAVRSGEHGKGFSLVAREIRRLADQSIQATERVREILEAVSESTSAAVKMSDKGQIRVEQGLGQVRTSGDNLRQLSGMVKSNAAGVRQIASAVNQQNIGIGQVFGAVVDQNKMMDATVKQLEASLGSVETLKKVTDSLVEVVGQYKV